MPRKKTSPLTPEAFHGLELLLDEALQKRLVPLKEELKEEIHQHQKAVDAYIKQTIGWHDEQLILSARLDRMRDVMLKKGLASREELAT